MKIEPIPADCLPAPEVIDAAMRGPEIDDDDGKIKSGTLAGMTPDEVIADREAFRRACGE